MVTTAAAPPVQAPEQVEAAPAAIAGLDELAYDG